MWTIYAPSPVCVIGLRAWDCSLVLCCSADCPCRVTQEQKLVEAKYPKLHHPIKTGSLQGSGQNCLPALLTLRQLMVHFPWSILSWWDQAVILSTQMTCLECTIFFFSYLVPFPWRLGQKRARSHTASEVKEGEKFSQISQIKQNQCLLICHHGRHHTACTHAYPWEHCITIKLGLAIFPGELHEKGTDFCTE